MNLLPLLAVADIWVIGMWVVNLICSILLGLGVKSLSDKQRKLEQVEAALIAITERLVDQKIGAAKISIDNLTRQMTEFNDRFDTGDERFDTLMKDDHRLEIRLERQTSEIKEFFRANCANKEDFKELCGRVTTLERSIRRTE